MTGPHRSYKPEMIAQLNRLFDRLDDVIIPIERADGMRSAEGRRQEFLVWHAAAALMRDLELLEQLRAEELADA